MEGLSQVERRSWGKERSKERGERLRPDGENKDSREEEGELTHLAADVKGRRGSRAGGRREVGGQQGTTRGQLGLFE